MRVYVDGVLVDNGPAPFDGLWVKIDDKWRHVSIVHEISEVVTHDKALSREEIADSYGRPPT